MPRALTLPKVTANDVLDLAVSATAATQELANLASFPPVAIAAGILLQIFQTIQKVQTNKVDCERLASRCLTVLRNIHHQMADRWEDAPPSLLKAIKKLEGTLDNIQTFLVAEAGKDWRTRLRRKGAIENALADFRVRLDDAERAFQIATLISIHYAVGDRGMLTAPPKTSLTRDDTLVVPALQNSKTLDINELPSSPVQEFAPSEKFTSRKDSDVSDSFTLVESVATEEFEPVSPLSEKTGCSSETESGATVPSVTKQRETESPYAICLASPTHLPTIESVSSTSLETQLPLTEQRRPRAEAPVPSTDEHGFRRYHQSDLMLRGRCRLKDNWWAGAAEAEVEGQRVLVKRYEGPRAAASEIWRRDVEVLRLVRYSVTKQLDGDSVVLTTCNSTGSDPELVRMLGYSSDYSPTVFIVLSNRPTRLPQGLQ